jgi:hypothetical protein
VAGERCGQIYPHRQLQQNPFPGTLLAAKRSKMSIGAFSTIEALIGKRIRMGRETVVMHRPFTALLQGAIIETPNLAVRQVNLTRSNLLRSNGSMAIRAFVDDTAGLTFRTDLLAGTVSVNVQDGGNFDASAALTGCVKRDNRIFKCRSADGDTAPASRRCATIEHLQHDVDAPASAERQTGWRSRRTGLRIDAAGVVACTAPSAPAAEGRVQPSLPHAVGAPPRYQPVGIADPGDAKQRIAAAAIDRGEERPLVGRRLDRHERNADRRAAPAAERSAADRRRAP